MLTREQDELLSRLERIELRWLSWGRVDGALSYDEVLAEAAQIAGDEQAGMQLTDDLLDMELLVDLGRVDRLYRTRFAESVRLFARDRQLLPGADWRSAPLLVNDFRVLARPRTFPKRDVPLATVLERLDAQARLHAGERRALEAMIAGGERALQLSEFQLEATERIRAALASGRSAATIVSAGTGGGKTKAFYLPVLSHVAADSDAQAWVRVLAVYPRNELLKDQIAEALAQVDAVAAGDGPVISLGAFFGLTAEVAGDVARGDLRGGWRRAEDGFACRYLRCPQPGCMEDLVWPEGEWRRDEHVLACPRGHWRSRPGQVVLTRERLRERPPHLLFTTTEMLNRSLADGRDRELVAGAGERRPRALLLDEVHAYGGVHGAQVALLLRRWRHALGRSAAVHVVGLSATLEEPQAFMRALTGLGEVEQVRPRDEDMTSRGAEYALILRGNPVSGTALLSTTIQTTFLAARLLESRQLRERTGSSGSRVFAFTDTLDVTNRLFWTLSDAEGVGNRRGPLAQLRAPGHPEQDARERDGQVWRLPQALGWRLDAADRLQVRRTSSQDAGVDADADVIVATSSLELGFDDPEVGVVVQHKAPRDDAAFLQRKGRAGRQVEMRPWMITVLSDYGRDRARYQAYESLLAPVLRPRHLPVDNLFVLKQQAAFALLDWLTAKVPGLWGRRALAWLDHGGNQYVLEAALRLRDVLEDRRAERDLERHVRQALALTPDQTTAVMWSSPRALMTDVVPTLLRRLETGWRTADGREDRHVKGVPLPEHAPPALFADLNLPEVTVVAPRHRPDLDPYESAMPVTQALSEFVPGRASRRFGIDRYVDWHWVPLPKPGPDGLLRSAVERWMPEHEVVEPDGRRATTLPHVLRPWRIELARAGRSEESASARPCWRTEIAADDGWPVSLPSSTRVGRVFDEIGFHTHALGNEAHVVRAIPEVAAEVADGVERLVQLTCWDEPVAVGFDALVDAVRVRVRCSGLPSFGELAPAAQRALRRSWFEQQVREDELLRARVSPFTCGWLTTLYVAAIVGVAISEDATSLADAGERVERLGTRACMERALQAVFVADAVQGRGLDRLRRALDDDEAIACVERHGRTLAEPLPAGIDAHVQSVALSTLGAALREAFQRMAPTFDVETLVIDVQDAGTDGEVDVWLCEPDVGSGGTIEELRRLTVGDPGLLMRLFAAALGPTDYETVDTSVRSLLARATRPGDDAQAVFADVRTAESAERTAAAQRRLRALLRTTGVSVDHAVVSTLNLRILRPGSGPETDRAVLDAFELWDRTEERLGLEADARSIAYAMSALDGALTLEQVYSLLWPRGRDARIAGLDAYSRFADHPQPERLTLHEAVAGRETLVRLGPAAAEEVVSTLAGEGVVCLVADADRGAELQRLVVELLVRPVDVGSVTAYARVVGAVRDGETVGAVLELPEALA